MVPKSPLLLQLNTQRNTLLKQLKALRKEYYTATLDVTEDLAVSSAISQLKIQLALLQKQIMQLRRLS
jgi:hypothetical protein